MRQRGGHPSLAVHPRAHRPFPTPHQHYKASLTATFNLFPVSSKDKTFGPREGKYGHKVWSCYAPLCLILLIWKMGAVLPEKGDGAEGDPGWERPPWGRVPHPLQEAKFAVVLEEDLDIAVDFFR